MRRRWRRKWWWCVLGCGSVSRGGGGGGDETALSWRDRVTRRKWRGRHRKRKDTDRKWTQEVDTGTDREGGRTETGTRSHKGGR